RCAAALLFLFGVRLAEAAPPTPTGPHPRLFLGGSNLATATTLSKQSGSQAKALVDKCQDTINKPGGYGWPGGVDGDIWPNAAVSCAFAYVVTQNTAYATQAIKYWKTSLNDDMTQGDNKGCVDGVSTNWQSWTGDGPAPPVILTVTHDTGYPM